MRVRTYGPLQQTLHNFDCPPWASRGHAVCEPFCWERVCEVFEKTRELGVSTHGCMDCDSFSCLHCVLHFIHHLLEQASNGRMYLLGQ